MKITVDLRSLQSGSVSGVENYTLNLLENLLTLDKKNQYALFSNSWSKVNIPDFHFVNAKSVKTQLPNKLLNLALKFNFTKLEKFTGKANWLFMPNLNQFNILPETKLAITVHDLSPVITPFYYNWKRRVWHKFLDYKKAYHRANVIFTVSKYTKLDLIRHFNISPEKIVVSYPGIDQPGLNSKLTENKLRAVRNFYGLPIEYILFLNTIEPRKNLGNLIKAFEALNSKVSLVIAGRKGWNYKNVLKQIRLSPKKNRIKYLGYVEESDKSAIIKQAEALVYPSFYEGFGFQPLEAMALGVPTVVSQVTSLPEVVQDSSIMVDPNSATSIQKGLEQILLKGELREKLIASGKARAKEFNWKISASKVIKELEIR